jgi:two-component system sensor histidine kinase QseC
MAFLRSAHAPSTPLYSMLGYADIEHAGQPWRSLILESASGAMRIQVAYPIKYRNKEALEIAQNAVLPLAFLLPIMIGLIYFSIRRGLKPLDDLAADVASRTSENLQPLQPASAPLEIKPLVKALNQFLGRLDDTLENERRFTADAAHELRTPLAALKVQAQIGMATKDPAQSRHALAQVVAGADRATHLVEQLLRLARLDPIVKLPAPRQFDLALLANSLVADSREAAGGLGKKLVLAVPDQAVIVSGDADLMGIALRNLIDNALRYTPQGTSISISVGIEGGMPLLAVVDNGPGVPDEELSRLAERFYRGSDVVVEGSGLGLAIVRRIAELHGARLEMENLRGGGFAARLRWGRRQ